MEDATVRKLLYSLLPLAAVGLVLLLWGHTSRHWSKDLPSPVRTW